MGVFTCCCNVIVVVKSWKGLTFQFYQSHYFCVPTSMSSHPSSNSSTFFSSSQLTLSLNESKSLSTNIAAQDESIKTLVSVGNESQIRTLNVCKTAPARLLPLENQSPWSISLNTQGTEIVHPDVGLACGSDELNGDGKTGGFKCVYMPAPGGSAQYCCSDVRQRIKIMV